MKKPLHIWRFAGDTWTEKNGKSSYKVICAITGDVKRIYSWNKKTVPGSVRKDKNRIENRKAYWANK